MLGHTFFFYAFIYNLDRRRRQFLPYKPTSSKEHKVTELNLLQEGKLSLHSLTGYPTCEHARVYSTKARQNVSSSSELGKKDSFFLSFFFIIIIIKIKKNPMITVCFFNSHAEVRYAAGYERIWVDVFVARQEWEKEKRATFLYGILHTNTI